MIELPKVVDKIISTLMEKNFSVHVVGGCVRDSLLGGSPFDWDMTTNASLEDMVRLFPSCQVISEEFQVARMEFLEEDLIVDLARYRVEGEYVDYKKPGEVRFVSTIEEDMSRRDFTINAVAYNPKTGFVDPFGGIFDIKNRIIRVIGDGSLRFTEDPIRILRAIRIGVQKGFVIEEETYKQMIQKAYLLQEISKDRIRDEFLRIVDSKNLESGFKLLYEAGILPYIFGFQFTQLSSKEKSNLLTVVGKLSENSIAQESKLALIYSSLEGTRAKNSLDYLGYGKEVRELVDDCQWYLRRLMNMETVLEFKALLAEIGIRRYEEINKVLLAIESNFELDIELNLKSDSSMKNEFDADMNSDLVLNLNGKDREKLLKRFVENSEPIFIKDLDLSGRELIESGTCTQGRAVGHILNQLLLMVHKDPSLNKRELLLKEAKEIFKAGVKNRNKGRNNCTGCFS